MEEVPQVESRLVGVSCDILGSTGGVLLPGKVGPDEKLLGCLPTGEEGCAVGSYVRAELKDGEGALFSSSEADSVGGGGFLGDGEARPAS